MKIRPIFKTIDIFSFIQFLSRQTNYIIKFFLLKVLYLVCHTERQGLSFQPPALGLLPDLNKPAVEAILSHQRIVSPLLNDPSLAHHHDLIRVPDGG